MKFMHSALFAGLVFSNLPLLAKFTPEEARVVFATICFGGGRPVSKNCTRSIAGAALKIRLSGNTDQDIAQNLRDLALDTAEDDSALTSDLQVTLREGWFADSVTVKITLEYDGYSEVCEPDVKELIVALNELKQKQTAVSTLSVAVTQEVTSAQESNEQKPE